MRASYAREKFGVAVSNLATGTGTIQSRLMDAYMSFHPCSEKDFPDELKPDWLDIYNALTTEEPGQDANGAITTGRVENTLKVMNDDDASNLAQKICDLNYMLHLE